MNSVYISGYGIVSAYGVGVDPLLRGLRERRPALSALTDAPVAALRHLQASALPKGLFSDDERGAFDIALAAVDEALRRAHIRAPLGDCALVCGANVLALSERNYLRIQRESSGAQWQVHDPGAFAAPLARALGIQGPVLTFSTACSSSANALLTARDLILRGQVARAVVMGIDLLGMITVSGFQSLMMLDAQGCRPFDAERAGLQIGEGAAALVLERGNNGPRLYAGANLCDIHHITSASPDGSGMARCMQAALTAAGVAPQHIVAIKVHGTASHENDAAEAAAMKTIFSTPLPPFTALKSYIGHTLSACGAMETVAMLAALDAGFVPATAGYAKPDPALACAPIIESLPAAAGHYLFNYFGFGGNYASLVMGHG